MTSFLGDQQIDQLREEGWCFAGRLLTDDELETLRTEERRFRAIEPHEPSATVFRSQLAPYSAGVREIVGTGSPVAIAQQVIGRNVAHWFNQFVTKLPDGGSGKTVFPWHQDDGYAAITPPTNITIWIALDDVDEENGCVWVLPRSHQMGLLPHGSASADSWYLEVQVEGEGVPAVLKAGEAVVFTGLTLHRSLLNQSRLPRRAFFIEYADAGARYARPGAASKPILMNPHTVIVAGEAPWSDERVRVE
jgi:hypothetical protein